MNMYKQYNAFYMNNYFRIVQVSIFPHCLTISSLTEEYRKDFDDRNDFNEMKHCLQAVTQEPKIENKAQQEVFFRTVTSVIIFSKSFLFY